MFQSSQTDTLTPIVARVLRIESITLGDPNARPGRGQTYVARYAGRLLSEDSSALYDQLAGLLRPLNITPLFRQESGQHIILLIPGINTPKPSNPWINLAFFAATVITVLVVGTLNAYTGPQPSSLSDLVNLVVANLYVGVPYTVALLSILLAHEFGHYLVSRYHKTAASLPYFIPFPSILGTMGAVIFQKEPHRNKRILLDIGMAGPLAGFVVAIPVLILGLVLSKVQPLPAAASQLSQNLMEGNNLLYLLLKFTIFHQWLPSPATFGGLPPLLYWVRYFFTGQPLPYGGLDVSIHPVAFAGWAGLLVTALNLIPAGQLDGGHIIHSLIGRRSAALVPFILIGLVLLGLVWTGWWLWALLIFFLGRTYAEPLDQITPLDTRRKILAVVCLVIFILVFTPVPLGLM